MPSGDQRQVCWEKITETNDLIRLTHPYSSGALSEQLVAIHALFGCLDQLVVRTTDDHVAKSKLAWWRLETQKENIIRSRHPIVRYMQETGAVELLHHGALQRLLDVTERKLDAKAPTDIGELSRLCCDIYEPRIEIESSLLDGIQLPTVKRQSMALKGGLILLLQDAFMYQPSHENAFWWIPLGLLARRGVSRAELVQNLGSSSAKSIFGEVHSMVVSGSVSGIRNMPGRSKGFSSHAHLLLLECLHERRLERLQKAEPTSYGEELRRFYLRDVFSLWKAARQIKAADHS